MHASRSWEIKGNRKANAKHQASEDSGLKKKDKLITRIGGQVIRELLIQNKNRNSRKFFSRKPGK